MNTETTASQQRYEKAIIELAQERFWKHPENKLEAIAKHYVAHALVALQACQVLKQMEHIEDDEARGVAYWHVEHIVGQIEQDHLHDFGTPIILPKPYDDRGC